MTNLLCDQETLGLSKTIQMLNELHDALEENAYSEEAEVVQQHIETLQTPQIESRVHVDGIELVMEEFAGMFCDN